MKILCIGGLGLIGSHLVNLLQKQGHHVFIYDAMLHFAKKGDYEKALNQRLNTLTGMSRIIVGDIRDKHHLRETLEKCKPEIVIHLAAVAVTNPRSPYEDVIFPINTQGSYTVFQEVSKAKSVKRIIFASSSMAYGNFKQVPQPEECMLEPIEAYGASKAVGETYLRQICNQSGKEWIIIRPTAVYGPTDVNNRVIEIFINSAVTGANELVVAEGERLDFTYVKDTIKGFALAVTTKNVNTIYNISTGQEREVLDVAKIIQKYYPTLTVVEKPHSIGGLRPKRGQMDIAKAKELLGYNPEYTLESGVKEYLEFVKTHV